MGRRKKAVADQPPPSPQALAFKDLIGEFEPEKPRTGKPRSLGRVTPNDRERAAERSVKALEAKALDPNADREVKIRAAVNRVLHERIIERVQPMDPKRLAIELAHYNMVHLGQESVEVITRIAEYARDPTSAHHEWALKFMGERVLPAKLAQEAMLAAAGLGGREGGGKVAPTIILNVGSTTPVTIEQERPAIDVVPEGSE